LLTGYAQWYEIVAVLLGVALIAMEIFVIPGLGVAGITGLVLVIGGLTMTFLPPINLPGLPMGIGIEVEQVFRGFASVIGGMAGSLLLYWWLSRYLPKLPYFGRLILSDGQSTAVGSASAPSEASAPAPWPLVGAEGRAATDLYPGGLAEFFDNATGDVRRTDVVCDCGYVERGTAVIVREVRGNRILVRPQEAREAG